MNTKLILAVLIFLFVISGTFLLRINQINGETSTPEQNLSSSNTTVVVNSTHSSGSNTTSPNVSSSSGISAQTLASHNTRSDCWIAYKGKVYDITSFLPQHPGGVSAISRYCGTSSGFESAFTRQHGTSKVGLLMNVATYKGNLSTQGGN